jgi:hypothetical protein
MNRNAIKKYFAKLGPTRNFTSAAQLTPNRVARFFLVHDTKTGENAPNEHKMCQMVIKYPK